MSAAPAHTFLHIFIPFPPVFTLFPQIQSQPVLTRLQITPTGACGHSSSQRPNWAPASLMQSRLRCSGPARKFSISSLSSFPSFHTDLQRSGFSKIAALSPHHQPDFIPALPPLDAQMLQLWQTDTSESAVAVNTECPIAGLSSGLSVPVLMHLELYNGITTSGRLLFDLFGLSRAHSQAVVVHYKLLNVPAPYAQRALHRSFCQVQCSNLAGVRELSICLNRRKAAETRDAFLPVICITAVTRNPLDPRITRQDAGRPLPLQA